MFCLFMLEKKKKIILLKFLGSLDWFLGFKIFVKNVFGDFIRMFSFKKLFNIRRGILKMYNIYK